MEKMKAQLTGRELASLVPALALDRDWMQSRSFKCYENDYLVFFLQLSSQWRKWRGEAGKRTGPLQRAQAMKKDQTKTPNY